MAQLVPGSSSLSGSFTAIGQSTYYKIVTTGSTQAINVSAMLPNTTTGSVQIFVGTGYVPTPQQYDQASTQFNSTLPSVVIPAGDAQTYYVTLYAQQLQTLPASYSIQAATVSFSLIGVSPSTATNGGSATLEFTGGGFTSSTLFTLVGSGGTSYSPTSIFVIDADHAAVSFDLTKLAAGTYSATAANGSAITLANALTVTAFPYNYTVTSANSTSFVQTSLDTPEAFRAGFPSVVTLHYTNTSTQDIPAPMIYLYAANATLTEIEPTCATCGSTSARQYGATFASGIVLGISHQGPAGVLQAGGTGTIEFLATPTVSPTSNSSATATFYVSTNTLPIDETLYKYTQPGCFGGSCPYGPVQAGSYASATQFCNSLIPPGSNANGFSRACMLLLNRASFTYTQAPSLAPGGGLYPTQMANGYLPFQNLDTLLATDATELSESGVYEFDASKVIAYELSKDGLQEWDHRYHTGAFGFGPSHPYDITLNAFQTPTITYPDGSTRVFPAVSANNSSVYLGTPGDYATLTASTDGSYLLTEPDGRRYHFTQGVLGQFDYYLDRAGNKTTFAYAAEGASTPSLTTVTDPLGRTLTYQYDGKGHITQYTDFVGRVTTYAYTVQSGPANQYPIAQYYFLTSVSNALGTTSMTWNQAGPSGIGYVSDSCVTTYCEPAIGIASITYPDGTHTDYTYDAAGRISKQSGDGGTGALTYTYNGDGTTTTTDALGHAYVLRQDSLGEPFAITDPLGSQIQGRYDMESKLLSITPIRRAHRRFTGGMQAATRRLFNRRSAARPALPTVRPNRWLRLPMPTATPAPIPTTRTTTSPRSSRRTAKP